MKPTDRTVQTILYALLALATLAAYFPLYRNGFVSFDDHTYLYRNPILPKGFSVEGLRYAFALQNPTSYWHPVTWLSLMLDYQLWGLNPTGYHLENLLFHLVNGLLLFTILKAATSQSYPSWGVALLFLLHPTAVESVAWAVERKTVLSTFFFLLALWSYLRYVKAPSPSAYLKIVLCMIVGLMAKSMIVTLPLVLLLCDLWPLGRLNLSAPGATKRLLPLLLEKVPLLLLSLASVALSLFSHPGSKTSHQIPIVDRLSHALVSACQHLGRIAWQAGHAVYYPIPEGHQPLTIILALLFLAAISIVALVMRHRAPWVTVGWFWYLITFAPVSGLVRAGKWPGMADRFLYIPAIGIMIAVCFSLWNLPRTQTSRRNLLVIALGCLALWWGYQANRQVVTWHDSVSLFSNAVQTTPDNSYAHYLLGGALYLEKKDYAGAEYHLQSAIALDSAVPNYKTDLAEVYLSWGKPGQALPLLQDAARIFFDNPEVLNSLGSALLETEQPAEALKIMNRILELNPAYKNALFNRGIALYKLGDFPAARDAFSQVLKLYPDHVDSRINLGMTLIDLKAYDAAIRETEQALLQAPNDANAVTNLGLAQERKGDPAAARQSYRKALQLNPAMTEARDGLQRLGATP